MANHSEHTVARLFNGDEPMFQFRIIRIRLDERRSKKRPLNPWRRKLALGHSNRRVPGKLILHTRTSTVIVVPQPKTSTTFTQAVYLPDVG